MENNFCDKSVGSNTDGASRPCAGAPVLGYPRLPRRKKCFSSIKNEIHTGMHSLAIVLRLIHILGGVYWAGTIFFFVTFLEPSLRALGPDGGKVLIEFFERGHLELLPAVAVVTMLSGSWLLWIVSAGFDSAWMGSRVGMAAARNI